MSTGTQPSGGTVHVQGYTRGGPKGPADVADYDRSSPAGSGGSQGDDAASFQAGLSGSVGDGRHNRPEP